MKTTKSIIVVLFVLLAAQIASAYYCSSTGRWLSRDPIGEPGFQTSLMASIVRSIAESPQPAPSRWISRDSLQEIGFNSIFGTSVIKLKSNSEIAHDYLAKLYLEKPYIREQLEPLAKRINWDMVKIPIDDSKQMGENNLYEFAINDPTKNYDFLGLVDYPPHDPFQPPNRMIDIQICIINWHGIPVTTVFGFTPTPKHCPTTTVQSCCNTAQGLFDTVYSGIISPKSYAVAWALADAYFNKCLNTP